MSRRRRVGYSLLGLLIAAMGFWIFPYQLERGDLLKTVLGASLAVLGALVFVRAVRGERLDSLEKMLDLLSGIGGS